MTPRGQQALRGHVEQALLTLFGPKVALAPRFQDIVNEAMEAVHADPELQAAVRAVTDSAHQAANRAAQR